MKGTIVRKGIEGHKNEALDAVRESVLRMVGKEQQLLTHAAWHVVQVLKSACVKNALAIRINDELVWKDFDDADTDDIGKLGWMLEQKVVKKVEIFASDDTGDVVHFVQAVLEEKAGKVDLEITVESEIQTVIEGASLNDFAEGVEELLDHEFVEDCYDDFEELVEIIRDGIKRIFGHVQCTVEDLSFFVPTPEALQDAFRCEDDTCEVVYPDSYYTTFGIEKPVLSFEDLYFRFLLADYAYEEMRDVVRFVVADGNPVDFPAVSKEVEALETEWFKD